MNSAQEMLLNYLHDTASQFQSNHSSSGTSIWKEFLATHGSEYLYLWLDYTNVVAFCIGVAYLHKEMHQMLHIEALKGPVSYFLHDDKKFVDMWNYCQTAPQQRFDEHHMDYSADFATDLRNAYFSISYSPGKQEAGSMLSWLIDDKLEIPYMLRLKRAKALSFNQLIYLYFAWWKEASEYAELNNEAIGKTKVALSSSMIKNAETIAKLGTIPSNTIEANSYLSEDL